MAVSLKQSFKVKTWKSVFFSIEQTEWWHTSYSPSSLISQSKTDTDLYWKLSFVVNYDGGWVSNFFFIIWWRRKSFHRRIKQQTQMSKATIGLLYTRVSTTDTLSVQCDFWNNTNTMSIIREYKVWCDHMEASHRRFLCEYEKLAFTSWWVALSLRKQFYNVFCGPSLRKEEAWWCQQGPSQRQSRKHKWKYLSWFIGWGQGMGAEETIKLKRLECRILCFCNFIPLGD